MADDSTIRVDTEIDEDLFDKIKDFIKTEEGATAKTGKKAVGQKAFKLASAFIDLQKEKGKDARETWEEIKKENERALEEGEL